METKQRIFDVATMLFAEQGYTGTSMREIAKHVKITEGGLYRHYDTKRDILEAILEKFRQEYPLGFMSKTQIKWSIENFSARTFLENFAVCFFRGENRFLFDAIRIICREAPADEAANTLANNLLYNRPAQLIEYALNLLIERGTIPDTNVRAFSLSWARLMIFTALRYDVNCRDTLPTKKAWEEYAAMSSWLIDTALTGKNPEFVHHIPAPVAI